MGYGLVFIPHAMNKFVDFPGWVISHRLQSGPGNL